ncbi:hypothetical protein [Oceanicoccus sagamiensis]|uniref:Uncharacterized protein n=1 Tax=Oceanicoccus sagamiensis TaxID=716816 RepID=A0A1X9N613_9GAMM|nr:hypothetical protein [Oceanicoccus sagamiensis]ARN73166.1 hypothetical protein BST96_03020 [Oceanicoccus sagamiensis]
MDIQSQALAAQLCLADKSLSAEQIKVTAYSDYFQLSVLSQLDQHFSTGQALPKYQADSFMAFVLSKPTVEQDIIHIHVFQPLDNDGRPTGELWIKMKSKAALPSRAYSDTGVDDAAYIQTFLMKEDGLSAEAIHINGAKVEGGPAWLKTSLSINKTGESLNITLPMLETPLDVPERFAGHFYLKLLSLQHPAIQALQ